jgi:hypothetical protein
VSGSRVASIERHRLVVRDVAAGGAEVLRVPLPAGAFDVRAAGGFAAVFARGHIVVLDLATGAERYRVPAQIVDWGLGSDGRVVVMPVWADVETILTATPEDTGLRPLVRVDIVSPRVAVARDSIAVIRRARGGLARVVIAGLDGSVRTVTPAFARMNELAYDGTTLAFNAGLCVYALRVDGAPPGRAPDDGCSDIGATLDFRRFDRIGQRSGAAVRVPLRCVGPPVARCPLRVTLRGPGFVTRRRFRIRPGLHVVRMPIPSGLRERAWREGMRLATRDREGGQAGAALPR